jgi:hypothetical protein
VVQPFLAAISGPKNAAAAPPVLGRIIEEIQKYLPVFIYFENYGILIARVAAVAPQTGRFTARINVAAPT